MAEENCGPHPLFRCADHFFYIYISLLFFDRAFAGSLYDYRKQEKSLGKISRKKSMTMPLRMYVFVVCGFLHDITSINFIIKICFKFMFHDNSYYPESRARATNVNLAVF